MTSLVTPELELSHVDRIVAEIGEGPESVIPILQAIQRQYHYLPQPALERVCRLTRITPADIEGVATFFTHFRFQPAGRHTIHVCQGTACHVKGAQLVQDAIAQHLKIPAGGDTDPRGEFTVQSVACLGCCTLAPVIQVDEATYGHVTPRNVARMISQALRAPRTIQVAAVPSANSRTAQGEIRIGLGSCCQAQGSGHVHNAIVSVLNQTGAAAAVKPVGCIGMCHQTPLLELVPLGGESKLYARVQPEDVRNIVLHHFRPRGIVRRLTYRLSRWIEELHSDERDDPVVAHSLDVREQAVCSFLGPQRHIATERCGNLDPLDLDEYLRCDGFTALRRCLCEYDAATILDELERSGLRGRGGAGFPTHVKWRKAREAPGNVKYVICNGDEGDPGAFMDRMLLESFPYRIIEGMTIAALATGAGEAIFYVRAEYPLAIKRIREALRRCEARGLVGERILESDLSVRFRIMEGAGAFICGEETALIHSLEGHRGTPRLRPPFPVDRGLWGRPTLINNVETLACLPWIFRNGGDAFAAVGTDTSKGTKVFALAGKVRRGGLIEVPMGVTLREIVEQVGGGVASGRQFKAVQVGGPSGGCVPAALADTPVDFEALTRVGAIMGSGGLVVLDDSDCMVDIARYFLRFTQDQSCGKCTFCRIGTKRMLEILDRVCSGGGKPDDLDRLESLARSVVAGSICGLGRTAPNPVLSTLAYFREEYEAHVRGQCPAGRCVDLIHYEITDSCIGCTLCAQYCPVNAIPLTPYHRHRVDMDLCTRCDTCRQVCPEDSVRVISP